MKYIFSILMITGIICTGILGCNANNRSASPSSDEENLTRDASYALGMALGTNLRSDNIFPNMEEFAQGMTDVLFGTDTRFSMEIAHQHIQQALTALMDQLEADGRREEDEFLSQNRQRPGIIVTGSGLQYEVVHEGTGPKPESHNVVRVHYEGSLANGMVFDSSRFHGEPIEFPLYGVISGWTEGLQLMNVGSIYRFYIPSDLGYGPHGMPPLIPPYSTLIFEIELLDIIEIIYDESEEP
jgi:FKBP-type peptidyl-prolyl cis-trans isomerase